jgi:hypothetical protein
VVTAVAFTPDGKHAVSSSNDCTLPGLLEQNEAIDPVRFERASRATSRCLLGSAIPLVCRGLDEQLRRADAIAWIVRRKCVRSSKAGS